LPSFLNQPEQSTVFNIAFVFCNAYGARMAFDYSLNQFEYQKLLTFDFAPSRKT